MSHQTIVLIVTTVKTTFFAYIMSATKECFFKTNVLLIFVTSKPPYVELLNLSSGYLSLFFKKKKRKRVLYVFIVGLGRMFLVLERWTSVHC